MPISNKPIAISIDTSTIIKAIALIIGIYLLINIWGIILIILASLLFSWALDPLVDSLEAKKIPRSVSLVLIYFLMLLAIIATATLMIKPLVRELTDFANNLPLLVTHSQPLLYKLSAISKDYPWLHLNETVSGVSETIQSGLNNILTGISSLLGELTTAFLILVITFYMIAEEKDVKKLFQQFAPLEKRKLVGQIIDKVQNKMGHWLMGQLFLCLVIFLFTYASLTIMGVKYALLLAIIAGITEAVPYLGPIIGSIPAILIALTQSPLLAILVAIMYLVIQQIENSVLVPMTMRQAAGLNPIVSIVVLLIGFELGGVLGAIMSIPLSTAISVLIKEWPEIKGKKIRQKPQKA